MCAFTDALDNECLCGGEKMLDLLLLPLKTLTGEEFHPSNPAHPQKFVQKILKEVREEKMILKEEIEKRKLYLSRLLNIAKCEKDASQVGVHVQGVGKATFLVRIFSTSLRIDRN